MMETILILGPRRSGSSAVAEVCHFLGVPAVIKLLAPMPPVWRFEWEDADLSMALAAVAINARSWPDQDVAPEVWRRRLEATLREKRAVARDVFRSDRIVMKCPDLVLIWDILRPMLEASGGYRVIRVTRNGHQDAVRRVFPPGTVDRALEVNTEIEKRLAGIPFGLKVRYEDLTGDPIGETTRIARFIGGIDPDRIRKAAARVLPPREVTSGMDRSGGARQHPGRGAAPAEPVSESGRP